MGPAQLTREVITLKDQMTRAEENYAALNEVINVHGDKLAQHDKKITHYDEKFTQYNNKDSIHTIAVGSLKQHLTEHEHLIGILKAKDDKVTHEIVAKVGQRNLARQKKLVEYHLSLIEDEMKAPESIASSSDFGGFYLMPPAAHTDLSSYNKPTQLKRKADRQDEGDLEDGGS